MNTLHLMPALEVDHDHERVSNGFTLDGSEGQGIGTQDLYFWGDARKHGYRCAIDNRVLVGHYDVTSDITW